MKRITALAAFALVLMLACALLSRPVAADPILYVNATTVDTQFTATGGDYNLGVLSLLDQADIVVEYGSGQTTFAAGSFSLSTSLYQDTSSDGLASGLFLDGSLLIQDSSLQTLLSGDIVQLALYEVSGSPGLLAATGLFDVTGGSLQSDFAQTSGSIWQLTFRVSPSDIDDLSGSFTGVSNVSLAPVPEPATLALLFVGSLLLPRLRRRA